MDNEQAVRTVAARAYRDAQQWQHGKTPEERSHGYDLMTTGVAALSAFGYKRLFMASGLQLQEFFENVREEVGPKPYSDPNRVPTKADVEAAYEWQERLELILLREFVSQTG